MTLVARRLAIMKRSSEAVGDGDSPGLDCGDVEQQAFDAFDQLDQLEALPPLFVADNHPDQLPAMLLPLSAEQAAIVVQPPSVAEMRQALSMGENVDLSSPSDCFRVLFVQNNVILRDALWHRSLNLQLSRSASSGGSYPSADCSPKSSGHSSITGVSGNTGTKKPKPGPPKVFRCPVCPELLNEKDFARHIGNWVDKLDKDEIVKSNACPGVRDPNHPLLQRFPGGNLSERVQCLVRSIRSLVRPGAYDAMSSEGSGRHIDVERHITFLLSRGGDSGN
jgi:hypothetical protein